MSRTVSTPFAYEVRRTRIRAPGSGYHGPMITLGIDPGTATCGFGVVALEGGRLRLLDAGCIRTSADESDAVRLARLHLAIGELVAHH
ncbi:MAG TPA: crossover junction endodeoxyribonuclease RuvC, partial [Candidatus Limnocylindria bacterium]|nr:crossover junction endodeoxyribonuclease RuvC [Candidatus Limnocylindria bacterium]